MNAHDFETVRYRIDAGIAFITLNRPEKLNAINGPMVAELSQCLDLAAEIASLRVTSE